MGRHHADRDRGDVEEIGNVTIQEEQSESEYMTATEDIGSTETEDTETELEKPIFQRKFERVNRGTRKFLTYDKRGEPSVKRYSIVEKVKKVITRT